MKPKTLNLIRLIILTFIFASVTMVHAAGAGFWKFSHVYKDDKKLDKPGSDELFLRDSFVSKDEFKSNGTCSLVLNYEMQRRKDKRQHIFRAKITCSGIPEILVPGQEYSTTLKTEQIEFVPLGAWSHDDARIEFFHSKARESINKVDKTPFFRLGELKLPGVSKKIPRVAEEIFKFTARAHSAGNNEYGIRLFMTTSGINTNRVFVYRWHSDEEKEAFHCPHCGKEISPELLPK